MLMSIKQNLRPHVRIIDKITTYAYPNTTDVTREAVSAHPSRAPAFGVIRFAQGLGFYVVFVYYCSSVCLHLFRPWRSLLNFDSVIECQFGILYFCFFFYSSKFITSFIFAKRIKAFSKMKLMNENNTD